MNTLTTNKMKKIINLLSIVSIIGSTLNYSASAIENLKSHYNGKGKYGYSLIISEVKRKEEFSKDDWIRSRERKIPCGPPNVVGIQSTSSSTLIASTPQPIPDYRSCPKVRLS